MEKLPAGGDENILPFPNRFRERLGKRVPFSTDFPSVDNPANDNQDLSEPLLSEGERLEIANELNDTLGVIARNRPKWNITDEEVMGRAWPLLNNRKSIGPLLDEAAYRDVSQTREDVLLYLAAARAYLKKSENTD